MADIQIIRIHLLSNEVKFWLYFMVSNRDKQGHKVVWFSLYFLSYLQTSKVLKIWLLLFLILFLTLFPLFAFTKEQKANPNTMMLVHCKLTCKTHTPPRPRLLQIWECYWWENSNKLSRVYQLLQQWTSWITQNTSPCPLTVLKWFIYHMQMPGILWSFL